MRWPSVRKASRPTSRSDLAIDDPRRLAIERIVGQVIATRRDGAAVDYTALESAHRELMPELGERLHRLRAVDIAAEWDDRVRSASPDPEGELDFREDAEFLGRHLAAYAILEHVHYGGQGVVFRAIQNSTNRAVAIKLLLDGPLATRRQQDRFAREVELVSRIRHPNIITVHDSGVIRRRPYLVMEYVDGLPIDDYVLLHCLRVREIVELFREVCHGVSAAHQNGVIHRDLKPANILVDPDGRPHILDFGLAKDLSDSAVRESISIPGRVVGTLPYLSPEQAGGVGELVDVRSDVYSLGVLLYQLIAGCFPYAVGGEPRDALNNILSRPARPLREALRDDCPDWIDDPAEMHDDLERIVLKSLEKEKDRRYQSASAFADDLGRYLAGDAVEAKAASRLYLLRKTVHKFRVHVTIAACFMVLLIASLIGVTAAWRQSTRVARLAQSGLQMAGALKVGGVARDAGRIDEAIETFEKVIEIGESVTTDDPDVRRFHYDAHHRLAELYIGRRELDRAAPHLRAAVRIAQHMAARHPDSPIWQRQLAFAFALQGRNALALAKWDQALLDLRTAEAAFRRLVEQEPDVRRHRFDRAWVLGFIGRVQERRQQLDDAVASHTEQRAIYLKLLEADPANIDYGIELARTEVLILDCYRRSETPRGLTRASSMIDDARARLQALLEPATAAGRSTDVQAIQKSLDGIRADLLRTEDAN